MVSAFVCYVLPGGEVCVEESEGSRLVVVVGLGSSLRHCACPTARSDFRSSVVM